MRSVGFLIVASLIVVGCSAGTGAGREPGAAAKPAQGGAAAPTPVPINVSYQPALYWSLPYFLASEHGWWEQMGLRPNFSTFPSGAPQVAALASKSWDVGGMGSAPAVLGATRYGLRTIGITNDESAANALMARGDQVALFASNPAAIRGKQILLTTNSTGEYAVNACLSKWGLSQSDVQIVPLGQAEIISAFSSGNGDLAGVWAPNIYTLEEKAGAKVLCSGRDAGAVVPGALVAREDFAREHPELVARYVAVYLHAQQWQRQHPEETLRAMEQFYQRGGVNISAPYFKVEVDTRPTFDLQAQLRILSRAAGGASEVDGWFTNVGRYLLSTGTIDRLPEPQQFITDEFMRRVYDDPQLRRFAEDGSS